MSYITVLPTLSFSQICKNSDTKLDNILSKEVIFTQNGREALMLGFSVLRLNTQDKILLPATICEVVLQACIQSGLAFEYYDLDDELQPKWDDVLKRICPKTKAIYFNHFFGRSFDIQKATDICQSKKLILVEDCAHAFGGKVAGNYLGTFGDISLFSLRKFFPVQDGGALVLNNGVKVKQSDKYIAKQSKFGWKNIIKTVFLYFARDGWFPLQTLKAIARNISMTPQDKSFSEEDKIIPAPMSKSALWMIHRISYQTAAEIRLINYNKWSCALKDIKEIQPLFSHLPKGSIPFSYPIIYQQRDKLIKKCQTFGIYLEPSLAAPNRKLTGLLNPNDQFARISDIAESIISLPVHQALEAKKMEWMMAKVIEAVKTIPPINES